MTGEPPQHPLDAPPPDLAPRGGPVVVARSPAMRAVLGFLRVIAGSESTVLITGETGTGKELIARLLHHDGPRRDGPFVAVSCAALAGSLVETELFGHVRGAFTGATSERPGRFELAAGGTLFLDDVDDILPAVQVRLLRALQHRVIERVGGTAAVPVDVRVIAGTKRSLRAMVRAGTFREDLFYRLNVLPLHLPPLRERREDIPVLADYFMAKFSRREPAPALSPAVRELFDRYGWPGNVRELEHACERIAQTCVCRDVVRCGCIPPDILAGSEVAGAAPAWGRGAAGPGGGSLDDRLKQVEIDLIRWALGVSRGNRSRAAALLGVKRSTLGDRIRRLGLSPRPAAGEAAAEEEPESCRESGG